MADRSVVVRLRADISDFQTKMRTAGDAAKQPGSDAEASAEKLTTQMGLMGAAVIVGVGSAVKKFADFDQQMSNVAATGDDARGSIDALREAAITAGADTAFSASEAAVAIEELAKAGISAEDILNGGLDGALALAASDSLDLGDAASYTATAMNQFSLEGDQATHVADLLAAGAGKAMGGVDDMGQALNQAGLVAAGMGLTIEETTGSLAAFAQQGLVGSDAGTSFKTMLQALANPSKESKALLDSLGISAYDTAGNFVGMADLAGQLQWALGDLTQAQRDQALAQIFGSDAVRAARVVYEEGQSGIEEWTAAVDDQGYAAETAATKLDNLKGDAEALGGSLETLMISAGEGADGPLRFLVQRATELTDAFGALPAWVQQSSLLIAGIAGVALVAVAGLFKLSTAARDGIKSMQDLGIITEKTGTRMTNWGGKVAKAAGIAAAAFAAAQLAAAAFGEEFEGMSPEEWESIFRGTADGADLLSQKLGGIAGESYNIGDAFDRITAPNWLDSFDDWSGDVLSMNSSLDLLSTEFENMGIALAQMYSSDKAAAAKQFDEILAQTGGTTEELLDLMPAYRDTLLDAKNAQDAAGSSVKVTTASLEEQTQALEDQNDAAIKAAGGVLDLRDAQRGVQEAIAAATEAVEKNGETLDITTEAGRENQAALDNVASAGLDVVDSMLEQGATAEEISGAIKSTRTDFVNLATSMGMSDDEANALADSLGLIPGDYTAIVKADTSSAKTSADSIRTYIDGLDAAIGVGAKWKGQAQVNAMRNIIRDQTVTLGVYADKPRFMGGLVGYASGGLLGGTPPANPRQDNLLASTQNGSLVGLRSGEFIQSEPAVKKYGVGFMSAVNEGRFPVSALAGYASGGYFAPSGYTPPAPVSSPSAPVSGAQVSVRVDASGLIDNDVADQIAYRAERKLMDAFNTYGLGQIATGVGV